MKNIYNELFFKTQREEMAIKNFKPCDFLTFQELKTIENTNKCLTNFKQTPHKRSNRDRFPPKQRKKHNWTLNEDSKIQNTKSLLNKITPDTYERLHNQILTNIKFIKDNESTTLVDLICKKAINEPYYCDMYIKLCILLSKESKQFNNNLVKISLEEIGPYISSPLKEKLGLGTFLSKLFVYDFIKEKTMNDFVIKLLPKTPFDTLEIRLEMVCKILIMGYGKKINKTNLSHFNKILSNLKDFRNSALISSRMKFLIDDTIELKENNWVNIRESKKNLEAKTKKESSMPTNVNSKIILPTDKIKIFNGLLIEEYFFVKDKNETLLSIKDCYNKYSNYQQIANRFVSLVLDCCIEKSVREQDLAVDIIKELLNNMLVKDECVDQWFLITEEYKNDIKLDIPKIDSIVEYIKEKLN